MGARLDGLMRYRQLGRSGLTVSVVGLGCNNLGGRLDRSLTQGVIDAALEEGITLFDTADVYGVPRGSSEEELGKALGRRRDDVVVATKFGMDMDGANGPDFGVRGSRRYVVTAVEASLRRLGTDRIDLLQLHAPDSITPIEETLAALDDLVHAGKVRYLGNSNFAAWQVVEAEWVAKSAGHTRFISAQNRYSLIDRDVEAELVPACEQYGIGLIPFFPLESGLLTGKYHRGQTPTSGTRLSREQYARVLEEAPWDAIEALETFAAERGLSIVDVAIGGLAAQPAVASVIAGAMSPDQVRANVAAAAWEPTLEDLAVLDELTSPSLEA
jgi:aryl-alcohol dehydrogenase-like predicted oxidoreductase